MKLFSLQKVCRFLLFASFPLTSSAVLAQTVELPALVSGDELQSIKGSTVNRNSSVGGSSSLTVGSSTTFGASVNSNSSPGTSGSSKSTLKLNALGVDPEGSSGSANSCPTGGCLRSSIGGDDSTLTGSITNVRASDAVQIDDTALETGENTYASGDVSFTGISGENNLVLDPVSIFESETSTNTVETDADDTDTKVSSAAASATIDTSTNADIKSSSFVSTFQQAF
jgi:hypothetical protein